MHAVGLHSALAIKRQRKRRDEQRRARERRYSNQSGESGLTSLRTSTASLNHYQKHQRRQKTKKATPRIVDSNVVTSIGILHIGIVFLVLGAFLLVGGFLPNDFTTWKNKIQGKWWNELVTIGLFFMIVGIFLLLINRIITRKEENDLEQYVQRQLTRSKSGHRLERDIETGALTTKHNRYSKSVRVSESSNNMLHKSEEETNFSSENSPINHLSLLAQNDNPIMHSNLLLEQIAEEEIINDKFRNTSICD